MRESAAAGRRAGSPRADGRAGLKSLRAMSGAPRPSTACYNCGTPLAGPFCSACGQKTGPLDPTVHDFVHDFAGEMFHMDGRIFRSVWKLLSAPGVLTRD